MRLCPKGVEVMTISRVFRRVPRGFALAFACAAATITSAGAQTPVSQAPDTPFKLATFEAQGRVRIGVVLGTRVLDISAASAHLVQNARVPAVAMPGEMRELIEKYATVSGRLYQIANYFKGGKDAGLPFAFDVASVSIKAPIKYPWNVLAAAANYKAHAEGMGAVGAGGPSPAPAPSTSGQGRGGQGGGPGAGGGGRGGFDPSVIAKIDPERDGPIMFAKSPRSTIIDPGEPYYINPGRRIDWEGEMAVIIGRAAYQVSSAQAHDYVFGYSIMYDVSDRGGDPPRRVVSMFPGTNWFDGKSTDRGAPFGPFIVPKEFLPSAPGNLRVMTRVNGVVKQDQTTKDLIWNEGHLIKFLTSILTLYPGDVIATGTPSGTGAERNEFLKPGDVVEIEIEGIGVLKTPMKAASERPRMTGSGQ
jgi:2-keto-4-pentenoate hydratase/2-oxohepta-3-ene-1,7-dioic acid hydratase in catechol pathway